MADLRTDPQALLRESDWELNDGGGFVASSYSSLTTAEDVASALDELLHACPHGPGMSAGRLAEALAPFVTCGERYCDTFFNGNPNCDDCTRLRGLAVQRVLGLLDNDEVHGAVADTVAPQTRYYDVAAAAALAAIRTHLTTPTKEEA